MENPNRISILSIPRGRAALLATAFLIAPAMAGDVGSGSLAQRALTQRQAAIEEGRELLKKGDQAYQAGLYADAVEAYSGARDLIRDVPASAELHAAATERYAIAAVEQAKFLARKGDVEAAKTLLDAVLAPGGATTHPGALAARAELDDPIRTNPALTAAHAKDVDAVRKLLYTAEGAYNLGKFDQALATYEEALRIDPHNTAARRGMERATVAKTDYYRAAGDHFRAEKLAEVDAMWELKPVPVLPDPSLATATEGGANAMDIPVSRKLDRIIISKVNLDQTSLTEAVEFLRLRASENQEYGPVNITVNLDASGPERAAEIRAMRFNLQLANVPLSQVLKYLTSQTKTAFTTDEYSVIIRPLGASTEGLVSRTFKVPPDFLASLAGNAAPASGAADPFAPTPSGGGLIPQRMTIQEALAQKGISFPDGALAQLSPATSTLRVVNTPANVDVIEQIVESVRGEEPVMIAVRTTMIKIQQSVLDELGFDWVVSNFTDMGDLVLGGGTTGNGLPLGTGNGAGSVTAGNRSGDGAIFSDSIDSLILQGNQRSAQAQTRAPGALAFNGVFGGGQAAMIIRTLAQRKGVDIMATPSVVTRSGQQANIKVVREFIYPTEYEPPELPNTIGAVTTTFLDDTGVIAELTEGPQFVPVTPSHPTAFETKDIGVTLDVLPVADANKQYIDITINPIVSDFDGFVNYGSPINTQVPTGNFIPGTGVPPILGEVFGPLFGATLSGSTTLELTPNNILMPVFSYQRTSTNVTVADGQTIVIAGMRQQAVQDVQDKVPVLGSIPVVGRLFQSDARQTISTAVIFLVNVQLIDPTGRPYKNR